MVRLRALARPVLRPCALWRVLACLGASVHVVFQALACSSSPRGGTGVLEEVWASSLTWWSGQEMMGEDEWHEGGKGARHGKLLIMSPLFSVLQCMVLCRGGTKRLMITKRKGFRQKSVG
jgi:hypothetical protein